MKLKFIRWRQALVVVIFAALVMPMHARATPLPADLTVTGSIEYNSDGSAIGEHAFNGGMFVQGVGGGSTGFPVTGAPVSGALTNTGNFVGAEAHANIGSLDEYFLGIDLNLDLLNNSATNTYTVSLLVNFINNVEAIDSTDAFARSEFFLEDSSGEFFYTDIMSDTLFGNEIGGVPTGGFGGPVDDIRTFAFDITLDPLMGESILGLMTFEGLNYDVVGTVSANFFSTVSIVGVEQVPIPEPSTVALLGLGLVGLGIMAHRRRKGS